MKFPEINKSSSTSNRTPVGSNNRRIARNAVFLYLRMGVMMAIGFITTRKLLLLLGVLDYGLVNVIGGVVSMFSSLSVTMSAAASRFFNYEIGKGDWRALRNTFNLTQLIYGGLLIILFVAAETIGLWVVSEKLVVPPDRIEAARLFFHFSVAAFLINVAIVPYRALLLAHENMKVFASISVCEAIGGLAIVYLVAAFGKAQLVTYGMLLTVLAGAVLAGYIIICQRLYAEARLGFFWDRVRFKEIIVFSGWNMFGALSGLFGNVLVNLLLNNYFGPVVNAARGVALQVATAVSSFGQNFMTAVNPQIIKYHATGDKDHMHTLAMRAARMGYFLLLIISIPATLEMGFLLRFWLDNPPAHSVGFAQLALVKILVDVISLPLLTLAQASGRIGVYQSVVGFMMWMNLPLSYFALKGGSGPEVTMAIAVGISIICLFLRLACVSRCTGINVKVFFADVLGRVSSVTLIAVALPVTISLTFPDGLYRFTFVVVSSIASAIIGVVFAGVSRDERASLLHLRAGGIRKLLFA